MHENLVNDWLKIHAPRAVYRSGDESPIPVHLGRPDAEFAALSESVALAVAPAWAQILVEGADAADYLHRRLSQAIRPLAVGSGTHALLLGGDGRMLADLPLWRGQDAFMLLTPRPRAEEAFVLLDKYILTDQVELSRFWLNEPLVAVAGRRAPELLAGLMDPPPDRGRLAHDPWPAWLTVNLAGLPCRVFGDGRFAIPWFHVSTPPMALEKVLGALADACREAGGGLAGEAALERLRIESGVTLHGIDTDARTIPLEAGLEGAISFDKGCFPGQEVLARVRNLGHPARVLARLTLEGEHEPVRGATLQVGGEEVGWATSSVTWQGLGKTEALGYLKWEARGADQVVVAMDESILPARVTPLGDADDRRDRRKEKVQ